MSGPASSSPRDCDFHVHTSRSWDSSAGMTVPAIRDRAQGLGIDCIGLSDHLWLDRRGRWRPSPLRLLTMRPEIARLPPKPRFLVGAEVDCRSEASPSLLKETEGLDFVTVADHLSDVKAGGFTLPADPAGTASRLLEGFRMAAEHPLCRIVGHPLYLPAPLISRAAEFQPEYAEEVYRRVAGGAGEIASLAVSLGVAVELNARTLDARIRPLLLPVFRAMEKAGCRFALGSDAHSLEEIGSTVQLADYAAEIGVRSGGLLTADELER